MGCLSDFIKIPKYNALNCLEMGMMRASYSKWSGFLIPENFAESDINLYTNLKITSGSELFRLYSLAVSEGNSDNQKKIDGIVRLEYLPLCKNPANFIKAISDVSEKYFGRTELSFFLGMDADAKNNLFQVERFFDDGIFSGLEVSGSDCDKIKTIVLFGANFGKPSKVSLPGELLEPFLKKSADSNLGNLQIINPAESGETMKIMAENKIPAIFSVRTAPEKVRTFFDSGVRIMLSTEKLLLSEKNLSTYALELYESGLFSMEEIGSILKLDSDN